MLTSDLLKYTTRKGQIYPYQLGPEAEAICASTAEAFKGCAGLELGAAKERLLDAAAAIQSNAEASGQGLVAKGLHKLLLDKCTVAEPGEDIAERRWRWLTAATALRQSPSFASYDQVSEYHQALADALGADALGADALSTDALGADALGAPGEGFGQELFADLPDKRRIEAVPDWPPAQLLARYNLAQIQGLILRARALKIKAQFADLGQQRAFFRQLKFQRLVAESFGSGSTSGPNSGLNTGLRLELTVSGPLAVLDSANSYGLRLAQFVPWVLALRQFELEAEVTLKRKTYTLKLSPEKHSHSHSPYRLKGHVPEELTLFLEAFAAVAAKKGQSRGVKAELAAEPVILPGGELICPDFTISGQAASKGKSKAGGKALPMELFHKWHKGGLAKRWQFKVAHPDVPLLIGACRSLKKKPEIAALVKNSPLDEKHVIWFSSFPSAGKVWENLANWGL